MGRLGVPPRQQQVYIRAQPHKLCDVQVHLLQDTLSQTPHTNVCDMRQHTHSHDKMIVTYGANEQTTHLHLRLNLYLLLDTSVSGLP